MLESVLIIIIIITTAYPAETVESLYQMGLEIQQVEAVYVTVGLLHNELVGHAFFSTQKPSDAVRHGDRLRSDYIELRVAG